jgi:BMFP domain-containing protein YqiC
VGYPARPEEEQFKIVMASIKTPEMRKQIRELEARLAALEARVSVAKAGHTAPEKCGAAPVRE